MMTGKTITDQHQVSEWLEEMQWDCLLMIIKRLSRAGKCGSNITEKNESGRNSGCYEGEGRRSIINFIKEICLLHDKSSVGYIN